MDNNNKTEKNNEKPKPVMSKNQTWTILIMIIVAGLVWMAFMKDKPKIGEKLADEVATTELHHEYRKIPIMGTMAELSLYAEKKLANKAADTARDEFRRVENVCNIFNPQSEISQLNKTAYDKPFKCSNLLWDVLKKSRRAYIISNGAFDITAKPLMDLWGFYRKRGNTLPYKLDIDIAKAKVGMDKVCFDDKAHTVRFNVKGMSFDLGGIAKGYAVDLAVAAVKKLGVNCGIINLGGNMYCMPVPPPGKKDYTIGITNPINKATSCGTILCKDISMATSGNYERYVTIDGVRYTHIMNVTTGKPVRDMLSVTVLTPKAVDSDYLSTSIFINGIDFARKICREYDNTQVLIIHQKPGKNIEVVKIGEIWGTIKVK